MKRPRSHVIEDQSEIIFKSLLPKEWIIRKIQKDYGIDYEVEIVEGDVLTGKRVWFQLKGTESVKIQTRQFTIPENFRENFGGKQYLNAKYIAFNVDVKLLEYSLQCDFPLLLGVVDVHGKEVYWLPLADEIKVNVVELTNSNWRKQKYLTVRIPLYNNFSEEKKKDYFGLKWYAMEPARRKAFELLHRYYHELQYLRLSGYNIGEGFIDDETELIQNLKTVKFYLQETLQIDCLFGNKGIDFYIHVTKPMIEEGLKACDQLLQDISQAKISLKQTGILLGKVTHAINLISTCISMYPWLKLKKRFLFTEEFSFI